MTLRAVILGLLGAILIAGFGFLSDSVLRLTYLVGNHFPISVFGLLFVWMIAVNPLLFRLRKGWRLRPAELAVMIAFMLVACSIPGSGLMRTFTPVLTIPIQQAQNVPGWKKNKVLDYVPPSMLPGGGKYKPEVMDPYLRGAGGDKLFDVAAVPWREWQGPLTTWMPLILLVSIAVICLSLIVHRQWASRERLRYPISAFAASLMRQEQATGFGPIFRNRLFWIGFGVIFCIRVVNGISVWWPQEWIQIPLSFDWTVVLDRWPDLGNAVTSVELFTPTFYPAAVAFAYFLAADVSFSLGISQVLFVPIVAGLIRWGLPMGGAWLTGGVPSSQRFGAYCGIALLLAYTGRRYYGQVLKEAFTFRPSREVERHAAWACRIAIASAGVLIALLIRQGLDWPFAALTVLLILLTFLVMARINAECGLFFCQPMWQPLGVLIGLFGYRAFGPDALIFVGLLCAVITIDPRECLMPFVVNGLKICDDAKVAPAKVGVGSAAVFAVGLAVAVPVALGSAYSVGVHKSDAWATSSVPAMPFNALEYAVTRLRLSEELDQSRSLSGWQRIVQMHPNSRFLWASGAGLALVVICSVMRLRFTWWPIHPVIFAVWGTYSMGTFSHSFLLGWMIKTVVVKLGGGRKYHQTLPLMTGVIAGDLIGGLTFMVHGAMYYAVTGLIPPEYRIFPG